MKTLAIAFVSAFLGATLAVGLIHGSDAAGALLGPPKFQATNGGSIPTELGELVHAGGDANQKILFFVDTKKTISIVRVTNKVSNVVTQITRTASEDESSGSPKNAKKMIGSMKIDAAGEVPGEWGDLVAASAVRNDATLFFQDSESKIRVAILRATNLTPAILEIERAY